MSLTLPTAVEAWTTDRADTAHRLATTGLTQARDRIEAVLREEPSGPIIVHGPTGYGKSLLLQSLRDHPPTGYCPRFLPFAHVESGELLSFVARWLRGPVSRSSGAIGASSEDPTADRSGSADVRSELADLLEPEPISGRRTLLMVDEIQATPAPSLARLRDLCEAHEAVLLGAGLDGEALDRLLSEMGSRSHRIELAEPWDRDDAAWLLDRVATEVGAEGSRVKERVDPDALIRSASGSPRMTRAELAAQLRGDRPLSDARFDPTVGTSSRLHRAECAESEESAGGKQERTGMNAAAKGVGSLGASARRPDPNPQPGWARTDWVSPASGVEILSSPSASSRREGSGSALSRLERIRDRTRQAFHSGREMSRARVAAAAGLLRAGRARAGGLAHGIGAFGAERLDGFPYGGLGGGLYRVLSSLSRELPRALRVCRRRVGALARRSDERLRVGLAATHDLLLSGLGRALRGARLLARELRATGARAREGARPTLEMGIRKARGAWHASAVAIDRSSRVIHGGLSLHSHAGRVIVAGLLAASLVTGWWSGQSDGSKQAEADVSQSMASPGAVPGAVGAALSAPSPRWPEGAPGSEPADRGAASATASARLRVNAMPWARVEIDGRPLGSTPLSVPVAPGRHRIRAEMSDGRVLQRELVVRGEGDSVAFR
ncbi:MAG: AAA family ATPase [bacterium]